MKYPAKLLFASAATLLAASSTFAATLTWDGGGVSDTVMGTAANWSGDTLPASSGGNNDTAQWNGTVAGNLSLTYGTLAIGGDGINLDITGAQAGSLTLNQSGATALRLHNVTVASGAGALTFGGVTGTDNITLGGSYVGSQAHAWTNNSSNAATISSDVVFGNGGGYTQTLLLTGSGDWNVFAALNNAGVPLTKGGTGTLKLSGASTYTGVTTVNAGTLITANASALGKGNLSVTAGTLQIGNASTNATLTLGAAATTVNVTVASGAIVKLGGFNLASLDATAGTNGVINLLGTGSFTLTGAKLDLGGVLNNLTAGNHTYNLLSGTIGSDFTLANILGTGYDASVTNLAYNAGVLSFTSVPEPSTYGLIGAGALAAVAFVRRRRKGAVQA